ncbi:MAG: nitroreductase family protein [Candidatus Eremiobacteraeota bacterium]|nr:nitroreductase family protein [Candidatus Eremiobacteraeota bacterium]
MELYEVMSTRRSIRKYRPDAVPEEILARVLEAVRIAPSGSNRQPWKFVITRDKAVRQQLVAACNKQAFIAEAPLLIVACGLPLTSNRGGFMGEFSVLIDVSIAVDHLTLAARNEGLGTCWIGAFDHKAVKEILGIPEEIKVVALIPLGYPLESAAFKPVEARKKLEEITACEKWS